MQQQYPMKVLITAGGSKEPIDRVRYIANFSTGQTGLFLTRFFLEKKCNVTLLIPSDIWIPHDVNKKAYLEKFTTFDHLKKSLMSLLASHHFDAVIHLAAVSDYFISEIFVEGTRLKSQEIPQKITGSQELTLKLKLNSKLLPQLKSFSQNKDIFVIGFKLTDTENVKEEKAQIKEMLSDPNIDAIVHNRLSEVKADQHIAQIYKKGSFLQKVTTKKNLAQVLFQILKESHT